jgi:hypothetical protein
VTTRLAHYQQRAAAKLPDRLDIERVTLTPDGSLGQIETLTIVASNVPCRVLELGEGRSDRELEIAGQIRSEGSHAVRLPIETDVRDSDILIWREHRLLVSRALDRSLSTLLTVVCMEVRP